MATKLERQQKPSSLVPEFAAPLPYYSNITLPFAALPLTTTHQTHCLTFISYPAHSTTIGFFPPPFLALSSVTVFLVPRPSHGHQLLPPSLVLPHSTLVTGDRVGDVGPPSPPPPPPPRIPLPPPPPPHPPPPPGCLGSLSRRPWWVPGFLTLCRLHFLCFFYSSFLYFNLGYRSDYSRMSPVHARLYLIANSEAFRAFGSTFSLLSDCPRSVPGLPEAF